MNHQIFERKWRSGAFSTGACLVQTRLQQTHTQPIRGVRAWTMGVTQQAVGLSLSASQRPVNRIISRCGRLLGRDLGDTIFVATSGQAFFATKLHAKTRAELR